LSVVKNIEARKTEVLSVEQAQHLVIEHSRRRAPAFAPLGPELLGLVLAEDVTSDLDMPPYDKALVDGYAVRAEELADGEAELEVVEEIIAGTPPRCEVTPARCARIMTGAMIPTGTDAVVMFERTQAVGEERVRILERVKTGQNILPQGKEMRRGDKILQAGTKLRPQELGLLATVGKASTLIYPRPVVAVLSTGDEVVEPSENPGPGQIRNSNGTMLMGQITRAGAMPRYVGIARDTLDSLRPLVAEGLNADVLLLSGGVSAGKLDLVPQVLEELGVTPIFHKVAMKPGKPLFFGVKHDTLVFGLPGNPVSSLVGFELFVRPALRRLMGKEPGTELMPAKLAIDFAHRSDRPTYHPAKLQASGDGWQATPVPWFGSPDLRALAGTNAFVRFEAGERSYRRGDDVKVLPTEL
jgi:molybdopterin molybdotransferase